MNRLAPVGAFLEHYKYAITIVVGTAIVGFLDDNSFVRRAQLGMQISDLEEEIAKYKERNETNTRQLRELKQNPRAYEKIARERYFMKTADEDIYILSDDEQSETSENETTE